jgi:hypothetical protein
MALSFTPEFYPGETILKESRATRYYRRGLKGGASNGRLWLTDRRLVFKAGFGYSMILPLYNITNVEIGSYGPFSFKVLHVTLDNGQEERFSILEVESWPESLLAAKVEAPPMPEALAEQARQTEQANKIMLAVIGVIFGSILLCAAPMLCLFPVLMLGAQ